MSDRLLRLVVAATILMAAGVADTRAQAFVAVKGKEAIPRGAFKTWSLFLVTSQAWLGPQNTDALAELYSRSVSFGRAIGDDHAAVWFWKENGWLSDGRTIAANIDVDRANAYIKKLKLNPSDGPYLVFTTVYPDENISPTSYGVVELGTSGQQISQILARLGDQLVIDGVIRNREFLHPTSSDDFWSAWFNATRHSLANLAGIFRIAIRTPTLSLESGPRP